VNALRVLIAEDHEDMRAIIVALLSSAFQVVGAVGDGEQLVQGAIFLKPDVIISDINMPRMDGITAKRELRSKGIEYPFVFITLMDLEGLSLSSSLEEGPVGYVHKNDIFNELKLAIHTVMLGNTYISRTFRETLGPE
jgi:DNA-binding NarL/FixJ family response regulator